MNLTTEFQTVAGTPQSAVVVPDCFYVEETGNMTVMVINIHAVSFPLNFVNKERPLLLSMYIVEHV